MRILTRVALFGLALFLAGCAARPTPAMYTFEREGVTLHLFGTIHRVPEEHHEEILRMPREIREAIAESDVVFLEVFRVSDEDREATWDERRGATGEAGGSVGDRITGWDAERHDSFLATMAAFPQLDHLGRQETFLRLVPYAARFYLEEIVVRVARLDRRAAVESWVMGRAFEDQIPVRGLEELSERERFFAELDQERILLEIEELFAGRRPTPPRHTWTPSEGRS